MGNLDTSLAIRLMLARKQKSQAWLANKTGLTRPYICSLCSSNSGKQPSISTMEKISEALDVSVSCLIKGGEE